MTRPKRKAMPLWVKREVRQRQNGRCAACGELWTRANVDAEYDHRPPLISRRIRADGIDYIPAQNDPKYIDALHPPCHLRRTIGRKPGAERTVTTKGSDIGLKAKFDRLEGRTKPKRKTSWPTGRKLQSKGFSNG